MYGNYILCWISNGTPTIKIFLLSTYIVANESLGNTDDFEYTFFVDHRKYMRLMIDIVSVDVYVKLGISKATICIISVMGNVYNNNGSNGHLFYVGGDLMMRRGMLPIIMLPDGDLHIALH